MKTTFSDNLRRDPAATAALAIFAVSLATLLGVWFFQFVLKLPPCPLCLEQRVPYYVVIPLSCWSLSPRACARRAASLPPALPPSSWPCLCSAALGAYHAGVEWRFWAGPTDCSGR